MMNMKIEVMINSFSFSAWSWEHSWFSWKEFTMLTKELYAITMSSVSIFEQYTT